MRKGIKNSNRNRCQVDHASCVWQPIERTMLDPCQINDLLHASELIIIFDTALRKANNSRLVQVDRSSWVGKIHRKWVRQTLLAISLHLLDRLKAEKRLNLIEFEMPSNWTCNMFDWCINKTVIKFCPNVLILQMFWINYLKSQRTK